MSAVDNRAVLAIDPGYARSGEGCACALFFGGELHKVWFERPDGALNRPLYPFDPAIVVVEKPQADKRSLAVPIGVLIELAWQGALVAATYAARAGAELRYPSVREWKGSEAKPLQHRRMWKVLSADERTVLGGDATGAAIEKACVKGALKRWAPGSYYPKSFLTHNLLDAAALGAKTVGRLA